MGIKAVTWRVPRCHILICARSVIGPVLSVQLRVQLTSPSSPVQVQEGSQAQDNHSLGSRSKTDIFRSKESLYRAPLSSRRNNGNLPVGKGGTPGFILPQPPYMGSLQQQHLQRSGVSLYSPRSKHIVESALHGQPPLSGVSPRRSYGSPNRDHPGSNPHSNLSQPAGHAVSAAGRPAVPQLRLQKPQTQLFSPRQYNKPAPLEGLSPRAAPHHSHQHPTHTQQGMGSWTWRGPPTSSQQLAISKQQHQQVQPSPSTFTSRY